jgi:hypothetical protein
VALLLGVFAVLVTPREEEPQINVTMANVLIPFPGASSVRRRAEMVAAGRAGAGQIAGIEHVMSVSRPGLAVLTVQFKVGVPRTEALVRLYDTLNANQPTGCRGTWACWSPSSSPRASTTCRSSGCHAVDAATPMAARTSWSAWPAQPGSRAQARAGHARSADHRRPGRAVHVWLDPARMRRAPGITVLDLRPGAGSRQPGPAGGRLLGSATAPPNAAVEAGEFLATRDVAELVVGVQPGQAGLPARRGRSVATARSSPARLRGGTAGCGRTDGRMTHGRRVPGRDADGDQEAGRERGRRGRRVRAGWRRCATP